MVFEITASCGAIVGIVWRISKMREASRNWPDPPKQISARAKVLIWAHVLAFVGVMGKFDTFQGGLMFGLIFVGALKLAEEITEAVSDAIYDLRS